jgi:hypothetical protein
MKTITLIAALLPMLAYVTLAEDPKGGPLLLETQSPKKEEKQVPIAPPKPTGELLGKRVIYGGYLTELARAENKRRLFNLRTPVDYKKDAEHLSFYPETERVQGVVLFSIKF